MKSPIDLAQRINNPTGWFDPRCCICYLREIPQGEKYDPNSDLMQQAKILKLDEDKIDDLKEELQSNFNKLLSELPKELVDEWKRNIGASKDYVYDPSKMFTFSIPAFKHSHRIISQTEGHVSIHEFCHFVQFLRTVASPMLIWAYMNLIIKAEILFQLTKQIGQTNIDYPIKVNDKSHKTLKTIMDDPAVWKILKWHYSRPNFLNASDIREAEAEFNSLLIGKHFIRFRKYRVFDHPITIHFREINKTAPQYARAYLETESALGDFAPSLFPLITYFALSMPFKKYSWFNIEDFEPVHPEEAFQAALSLLKEDISVGLPYAKSAQQSYKYSESTDSNRPLEKFCKKVCKINGWIYPSRRMRKKWINRIFSNQPFLLKLFTVLDAALNLDIKYGGNIFSEPFNKINTSFLQRIPFPPIIFSEAQKLKYIADTFWSNDFIQAISLIRVQMGIALSIFYNSEVNNECPHKNCRYRKLNLCNSVLIYPESSDSCGFCTFIEEWSGLPISNFKIRS